MVTIYATVELEAKSVEDMKRKIYAAVDEESAITSMGGVDFFIDDSEVTGVFGVDWRSLDSDGETTAIWQINRELRHISFYASEDVAIKLSKYGLVFARRNGLCSLDVDMQHDFDEVVAYIENYGRVT